MRRSRVILLTVAAAVVLSLVLVVVSQRMLVAGREVAWSVDLDDRLELVDVDDDRVLIHDRLGAVVLDRESGEVLQRVDYSVGREPTALLVPDGVVSYGRGVQRSRPHAAALAFHAQPDTPVAGNSAAEATWTVPSDDDVTTLRILGLDVDAGVLAYYESVPGYSRVRGIDLGAGSEVWEEPVDAVLVPSLPLRGGRGSDPVPTARFVMPVSHDDGESPADEEFSLRSTESGEELGRFPGSTGWVTDRMIVEEFRDGACGVGAWLDGVPLEFRAVDTEECVILAVAEPDTVFILDKEIGSTSTRLHRWNLTDDSVAMLIDDVDMSGRHARDRWAGRVSAAFTLNRHDEAVVVLDSTSAEELVRWPVESPWSIEAGPDAVLVTTALPGWRALLGGAKGAEPRYLQVRDPRTGDTSGRLVLDRAPWSAHVLDGRSAIVIAEGTVTMLRI
ncbi:hypothetical protein [Phytoactinopolyspora mesophila]|uniref:Uncharacterized protein n=1 Tax=Phytoactinopolyspora mesophila TaxID=2650750 RepID=A0A7K3LZV9_9ACTN|nr:hypothetical protein [Phytoactinopolyspora mesophila]NDL56549.1 hypothetical protein [Phytoactinopolyspora mesophila]